MSRYAVSAPTGEIRTKTADAPNASTVLGRMYCSREVAKNTKNTKNTKNNFFQQRHEIVFTSLFLRVLRGSCE